MTNASHVDHLLNDYLDGNLSNTQQDRVENHVSSCSTCHTELALLNSMLAELHRLPQQIEPSTDLWESIELQANPFPGRQDHKEENSNRAFPLIQYLSRSIQSKWKLAASAAIVALLCFGVLFTMSQNNTWRVTVLAGAPSIGEISSTEEQMIQPGEWIKTDAASRARLTVGTIGNVDLAPKTRLQLRSIEKSDHRLNLVYGRIHARIWAPPRQFFVETPAGLAIDLGCEYTLDVDSSGQSLLHVLSGYVGFARSSREVIVPAGWKVRARPNHFPGTPFSDTASPALRNALAHFDFGRRTSETLTEILHEARPEDGLTLWELLWRVQEQERPRVYDRLVTLVPPPQAITREGVLSREPSMVNAWRHQLGVDIGYWLDYKKKKKDFIGATPDLQFLR